MIAIIPARGGSKGIKNKNLQLVGDKSLIRRAVETCNQSKSVEKVYVSSDDENILQEAKKSGALAIKRPKNLSDDFSTSESAILHAISVIEKHNLNIENILFFQATSPFVSSDDIDNMYKIFTNNNYDSMFSSEIFHGFLWKDQSKISIPIGHDSSQRLRRQDMDKIYKENGALYMFNKNKFLKHKHRFFGKIGNFKMPPKRSIEIDNPLDLFISNKIFEFYEK